MSVPFAIAFCPVSFLVDLCILPFCFGLHPYPFAFCPLHFSLFLYSLQLPFALFLCLFFMLIAISPFPFDLCICFFLSLFAFSLCFIFPLPMNIIVEHLQHNPSQASQKCFTLFSLNHFLEDSSF